MLRSNFRKMTSSSIAIAFISTVAMVCAGFLVFLWTSQTSAGAEKPESRPPFTDYRDQQPGAKHKITLADLPELDQQSSVRNDAKVIARPNGAWPQAPAGFKVTQYATGLENPRLIRTAPNGDLFVTESQPGRVKLLRGVQSDGKAETVQVFASGFNQPFGIAFYPPGPDPKYIYIANTDSVVRFPYQNGDLKARGSREVVVKKIPAGGRLHGGGHWTRDIAFSNDGSKMFISVGSHSNVDENNDSATEYHRADILVAKPDGSDLQVYASGIRNPVGIAVHPETGELWASVNERDGLGDNLVPDYITHVEQGKFYGWPWFYMGGHQDPRHAGEHPELQNKVATPDVLIQAHSASLEMTFYRAKQFPSEYFGDIFAAEHGSWNKSVRTGYKVIQVPLTNGHAPGEYINFLTGFVTSDGQVWGRPVGVTVAEDGSLIVTDDGSNTIWRVHYEGAPAS
jgi:glucose/arabinose dehydrogenase